ncbi:MAG: 8-amino-7-oxononanoate synthase [Alphaproteobacteria bacterium]|nr:8-amino-7-oxononanoate synthase [Alphaproteobacteria bacterium]
MPSLEQFAKSKLAALEAVHRRRVLAETDRADAIHVVRDDRAMVSFSCNDYLNLTHHPAVKAAAVAAIERHGTGAGASRLITGNHPLYSVLEDRLAQWKGAEAACVFGSGYLANAGIIPVLVGPDDLVLVDALSHSCLWAGAQLSRGHVEVFRHNDADHLRALLESNRGLYTRTLIVTDGVFSMDGDLAPLAALSALAEHYDAWLMSDDAHGLGVLGGGHGSASACGEKVKIDLQMGTLSKALGSYGGYLCASRPVIDLIKTRARTLVYSTGLPPASVAAALAALDVMAADPALCRRPLDNARAFTRGCDLALAESPIVPLILGEEARALAASKTLEEEGFLVTAIRPPTVPAGTARLRFAFTAGHTAADIVRLCTVVRNRILPQGS